MRIAFIHPDLGIGGAERLVVDAAVGLQKLGHEVVVYTSHCDKSHCFEEVKDGTLNVVVSGNTVFPAKLAGRFAILCAILRQLHLTWNLAKTKQHYDVYIVDQLSACVPFLRLREEGRIVFYGHFPDQLLAKRDGFFKQTYRLPFDWFERWSTNFADLLVVNSKFTRTVFRKTMQLRRIPEVVYPCVDTTIDVVEDATVVKALRGFDVLFSINRFERTKKIDLAIESFAKVNKRYSKAFLVVAGGYDLRVAENVEYLKELQELCDENTLKHHTIFPNDEFTIPKSTKVLFLPSVSTDIKNTILLHSKLLLYTPANEHFGIVPLEAMRLGVPVLGADSGGPLETIVDSTLPLAKKGVVGTGWNRPQDKEEWAKVISRVLEGRSVDTVAMAQAGKERVQKEFSADKMAKKFQDVAEQSQHVKRQEAFFLMNFFSVLKGLLFTAFFSFFFRNVIANAFKKKEE